MGVSVQPFMMALTVIAAAAFLTPIATPVNLMVMEAGRLPLRRLLEARAAAGDHLPALRGVLRAADLAVLSRRDASTARA